uniref:AsIV-cont00138-ORF1 n=1 Tax=Apophua simplicipes ichnovirus TaxID=1329648 RepID=S5DRD7_9VIRU|nr:AsIV-cont00138-ORF1 [Apophua simplicipes ichnovirus]
MENSRVRKLYVARDHLADIIVHEFSQVSISTSAEVQDNLQMKDIRLQIETDDAPKPMANALESKNEIETVISSSENDDAPDPRTMTFVDFDSTWMNGDDESTNLNRRQRFERSFKTYGCVIFLCIVIILLAVVSVTSFVFAMKLLV